MCKRSARPEGHGAGEPNSIRKIKFADWPFVIAVNKTALTSMHFSSNASGELLLTVSNIVTRDNSVVTSRTILPGTISGTTTKLPQLMDTNSVEGR